MARGELLPLTPQATSPIPVFLASAGTRATGARGGEGVLLTVATLVAAAHREPQGATSGLLRSLRRAGGHDTDDARRLFSAEDALVSGAAW